jgi:hypothetical protein
MCRNCEACCHPEFPIYFLNKLKDLDAHTPDVPWNEQIKTQKINSIGFLDSIRMLLPQIIKVIDPNYIGKKKE